jgi:hypothetical protein
MKGAGGTLADLLPPGWPWLAFAAMLPSTGIRRWRSGAPEEGR